jgi:hypothetical protein
VGRFREHFGAAGYTKVMAIEAEVYVEIPNDEVYFNLVRTWLLEATPTILPELWPPHESGEPDEPPGSIRAYLSIAARPWDGTVSQPFSAESRRWFERELRMRPLTASLGIEILDSAGRVHPEEWSWTVKVYTDEDLPSWVRMRLTCVSNSAETDPRDPEISRRWVEFIRRIVARVDPAFGYIGSRAVPLEVSYGEYATLQIVTRRDFLRGCSWITICPSELFDRLGGAPSLEKTGLFSRIEKTPSGAAILQATERLSDFTDGKAVEIARCLSDLHSRLVPSKEARRQRLAQQKKRPKLP